MSDNTKCDDLRPNDLVKYLRNSKGWPTLGNKAADRIEELEAKLAKALEALEALEPEEPMSNPGDKDYEV